MVVHESGGNAFQSERHSACVSSSLALPSLAAISEMPWCLHVMGLCHRFLVV
jgi:hypothetical protein